MSESESTLDPVLISVMANRLDGIVREMTNTLLRSARSAVITTARDFSCCLVTGDDKLLAPAEGLPVHNFRTESGEIAMKCPTEVQITDRREKELADLGFAPLVHQKGTANAAFFSVQSAQKPKLYDDPAASSSSVGADAVSVTVPPMDRILTSGSRLAPTPAPAAGRGTSAPVRRRWPRRNVRRAARAPEPDHPRSALR